MAARQGSPGSVYRCAVKHFVRTERRLTEIALIICLILSACDDTPPAGLVTNSKNRSIKGTVFIVTKGAEAQRLALVPVAAVPYQAAAAAIKSANAERNAERQVRWGSVSEAEKAYGAAELALLQFKGEALEKAGKLDEIGSIAEKKAEELQKTAQLARRQLLEARARYREASEMGPNEIAAIYRSKMPPPAASGSTNANGEYDLTLPSAGNYLLIAQGSRSVGNTGEIYHWFVPASPSDKPLDLDNTNLLQGVIELPD